LINVASETIDYIEPIQVPICEVDTAMEVVSIKDGKKVKMVCPSCQLQWDADVSKFYDIQNKIIFKARCKCGYSWNCRLEKRQNFRRAVSLPGTYKYVTQNGYSCTGNLEVLDISIRGLKIRLDRERQIQIGEVVEVEYQMDDKVHKIRRRQVTVKNMNGKILGVSILR
jgi:hypothetical protein